MNLLSPKRRRFAHDLGLKLGCDGVGTLGGGRGERHRVWRIEGRATVARCMCRPRYVDGVASGPYPRGIMLELELDFSSLYTPELLRVHFLNHEKRRATAVRSGPSKRSKQQGNANSQFFSWAPGTKALAIALLDFTLAVVPEGAKWTAFDREGPFWREFSPERRSKLAAAARGCLRSTTKGQGTRWVEAGWGRDDVGKSWSTRVFGGGRKRNKNSSFTIDSAFLQQKHIRFFIWSAANPNHDPAEITADEIACILRTLIDGWKGHQERTHPTDRYEDHLPPGPKELVGREADLEFLDQSLADPKIRIVVLHGVAGIGKTAVVSAWKARLAQRNWRPISVFSASDVKAPEALAAKLRSSEDGVSKYLQSRLEEPVRRALKEWSGSKVVPPDLIAAMTAALNKIIGGASIWDEDRFRVAITKKNRKLINGYLSSGNTRELNRHLLETAFKKELAKEKLRPLTGYLGISFEDSSDAARLRAPDDFVADISRYFKRPEAAQPRYSSLMLLRGRFTDRFVLVVDSLDRAQLAPPGEKPGPVGVPELSQWLRALAGSGSTSACSLCIVTSRHPVPELEDYEESAPQREIQSLDEEDGAKILHNRGANKEGRAKIPSDDRLLREASVKLEGHPAALNMYGLMLAKEWGGDIKKLGDVQTDRDSLKEWGPHLVSSLACSKSWHDLLMTRAEEPKRGRIMVGIMRLLSLFDSSVDQEKLDALRRPLPAGFFKDVNGVAISEVEGEDWEPAMQELEDRALIWRKTENATRLTCLDRYQAMFYHEQLDHDDSLREAWREAQGRLAVFCVGEAERNPFPKRKRQRLFQAAAHYCHAGNYQAAFRVFSVRQQLGAGNGHKIPGDWNDDRALLSRFYKRTYSELQPGLEPDQEAAIYYETGVVFRRLGRLDPPGGACDVFEKSYRESLKAGNVACATKSAIQSCEIAFLSGSVQTVQSWAARVREMDGKIVDQELRVAWRTALAHALQQMELRAEAETLFGEAVKITSDFQGEQADLSGSNAFRHLNFLLDPSERAAWRKFLGVSRRDGTSDDWRQLSKDCEQTCVRASAMLAPQNPPRANAPEALLPLLCRGRAGLHRAILKSPPSGHLKAIQRAKADLEAYVQAVQSEFASEHLPRGLVCLAWATCLEENGGGFGPGGKKTKDLLDQAYDSAERCESVFFLAENHLFRARLLQREDYLAKAQEIIEAKGLFRRQEELDDAKRASEAWRTRKP